MQTIVFHFERPYQIQNRDIFHIIHGRCFSRNYCLFTRFEFPHLHDELVSPRDEGESVGVVERLAAVVAERVARASRRDAPTGTLIRVRPEI